MTDQPSQLVFEDVTDQWEIACDFSYYDDSSIFAHGIIALVRMPDGVIDVIGEIWDDKIYTEYGNVLATRKQKKPPEPKYVPFANAEEARSFVGCQPYVRPINGDWAGIQMAYVWDWDELCERYMWSNTPDDPSSWKPFGKLVTE